MEQKLIEIFKTKLGESKKIIFSDNGNLNYLKLQNILERLEGELISAMGDTPYVRKLYTISVEILQNIYHHADRDINGEKCFFFIICRDHNGKINVISGNLIDAENKQIVQSRIEQINSLDTNEIKDLYLRILNDRQFTSKGGGSLGIIDIKRKSKEKLFYSFEKLNSSKFIFIFEVSIKEKKRKKNEVISY